MGGRWGKVVVIAGSPIPALSTESYKGYHVPSYNADLVEVDIAITDCRDPKDNKFLELAVSGQATHLVTGDRDLLVLHPYRSTIILTPRQFLAEIASPS